MQAVAKTYDAYVSGQESSRCLIGGLRPKRAKDNKAREVADKDSYMFIIADRGWQIYNQVYTSPGVRG